MGGENMAKVGQRWMQQVRREMERKGTVGALRRQLGVPEGQKIPESWLSRIANAEVGETVSLKFPSPQGGSETAYGGVLPFHPFEVSIPSRRIGD